MLRGFKTGLAMMLVCCAAAGAAGATTKTKAGGESSVFDLFDRGVMSIVAANACKGADKGGADKASLQKFTRDFSEVAGLVEDELQSMNPESRRDDLAMLIGFRVAQLELRAEKAVKSGGCEAAEVKAMRELFDLKAHLATVKLSANTITH